MSELLAHWFASGGFVQPGPGQQWASTLLWTYVISDIVIGIAFYATTAALLYLACRRPRLRFKWLSVLFAVFLFVCGTAQLVSVWPAWYPYFWLGAAGKAVAAIVSAVTVVMLWWAMPQALKMPTSAQLRKLVAQLEHEITERSVVEEALRQSQETLRELAAYQERIREDERKRIAREIHDELGQNLLALRLDVSMLHARAGKRHPQLRKRAELALEYIDTTMKSIRAIINNLRPSVLDLGLTAAIEWLVVQFEHRNGIPCELMVRDNEWQVDDEHATAVFRILQESLTNVGRHACATLVQVELGIEDHRLQMTIRDNGVGMYPNDRRKARRFGLIGIQERAVMLGGELAIESSPGQGTVLRLWMPLQEQQAVVAA